MDEPRRSRKSCAERHDSAPNGAPIGPGRAECAGPRRAKSWNHPSNALSAAPGGRALGLDQAQGLRAGEGEGGDGGDEARARQAIAAAGITRCQRQQLDALRRDVGAAATAAGTGLGGDDDVDPGALRIAAADRERRRPADRDLPPARGRRQAAGERGGGGARRP